jgi:hypothetical protein
LAFVPPFRKNVRAADVLQSAELWLAGMAASDVQRLGHRSSHAGKTGGFRTPNLLP